MEILETDTIGIYSRKNIENTFDDFLENYTYHNDVYFELLKFEHHFSYLKGFLIHSRRIGDVVKQWVIDKKSTQDVLDDISILLSNHLNVFEIFLIKWIIAHWLFLIQDKFEGDPNILFKTVRANTKREAGNFDLQIEIIEPTMGNKRDFPVWGIWRLVEKVEVVLQVNQPSKKADSNFTLGKSFSKIDYIRIIDALCESKCFATKDIQLIPHKKDVMKAFGEVVGVDLSNYDKDLSKAFISPAKLETNIEIFNKLIRATTDTYYKKNP